MLLTKVSIHTITHIEAPIRVPTAELSARLAKTFKRIRMRASFLEAASGIQERRFWQGNQAPSAVATQVAEKVIEKSGLSKTTLVRLSAPQ